MKKIAILSGAALSTLVAGPALAHPGEHHLTGFEEGVMHLLGHADHAVALIVALAVVGLLSRRNVRARIAEAVRKRRP